MRSALVCVLVALPLVCAAAQSHSPSPRPAEVSQPPQQQASGPQPATESDKRGTKNAPLVVETVEGPSDAAEKKTAAQHRQQEASNSRLTRNFTGGMLLVAVLQASFFLWQLILLRASSAEARQVAEAAKISADAAQRSVISLIHAERAYIFAEFVLEAWPLQSASGEGVKNAVTLKAWNYGKTPAILTNVRASVLIDRTVPQALPEVEEQELPRALGVAKDTCHEIRVPFRLMDSKEAMIRTNQEQLYCVGKIGYLDVFNESHEAGFCWELKKMKGGAYTFIPTAASRLNCRS